MAALIQAPGLNPRKDIFGLETVICNSIN